MKEYLSGFAGILGVLLTAIGAYFAYRKSEIKRENEIKDAARRGQLTGAAGMVMSAENAKLYVEEFSQLTSAILRLAIAHEAATKVEREKVEPLERASKETIRIGEAMEDIARVMRRRENRGE